MGWILERRQRKNGSKAKAISGMFQLILLRSLHMLFAASGVIGGGVVGLKRKVSPLRESTSFKSPIIDIGK